MALSRLWAGRIFGTSTGNVFVKLQGADDALTGTVHLNEAGVGVAVYSVAGAFDGTRITLSGDSRTQIEGFTFARLTAVAGLNQKGELVGTWETATGSAGTLVLYPHDHTPNHGADASALADQLHTVRWEFGAVKIDREQVLTVADGLQQEFKRSQVIVTVVTDTEQSRFLTDFRNRPPSRDKARAVKLFAQENEEGGLNRVVQIELGPLTNSLSAQGGNEAWVLGVMEKLKRAVRPFERTYVTNFKKYGFGFNQLLLTGAIVFLPSLDTIRDRAILMFGILALILVMNWLHQRYLPPAVVYLDKGPLGLVAKLGPTLASWALAASASLVAALLATYLI